MGSFFLGGPWYLLHGAFVVAMASPVTSPFLRAFQHWNWAGFPAAFQPIQSFEGVREPLSSKCLSPCQSKPWGQGWLSAASSFHTSALGLQHPHGHCRYGLFLQENRVTPYPGHDLPPAQGTALHPNTHRQFVHCFYPPPYSLIPLKAHC